MASKDLLEPRLKAASLRVGLAAAYSLNIVVAKLKFSRSLIDDAALQAKKQVLEAALTLGHLQKSAVFLFAQFDDSAADPKASPDSFIESKGR